MQLPEAAFGVRAGAVETYHVIGGNLLVHMDSIMQKAGSVKVRQGLVALRRRVKIIQHLHFLEFQMSVFAHILYIVMR